MPTNDFIPFATAGGARVMSQSDYAASSARTGGNPAGLASGMLNNKALRQASTMACVLATAIASITGQNVADNGDVAGLAALLESAFAQDLYAVDSGIANAYVAAFTPAVTAYRVGMRITLKITNANTGVSTFDAGAGAHPVRHAFDLSALTSGEFKAGTSYVLMWDGTYWQLMTPTEITNGNGTCRFFPDGWKEQFGVVSGVGPDATASITFPVPFLSTPICINSLLGQTSPIPSSTDNTPLLDESTLATTGCGIINNKINGSGVCEVRWEAKGR